MPHPVQQIPADQRTLALLLKFVTSPLIEANRRMEKSDLNDILMEDREMAEQMIDLADIAEETVEYLKSCGVLVEIEQLTAEDWQMN